MEPLRALLLRTIRPRNPDSPDAWRERLLYIFLNLLIVVSVLTAISDFAISPEEGVFGLLGVAITVSVRIFAERAPRAAGWLLVIAGMLYVRFVLGEPVLSSVNGGLTLGLLALLGGVFAAPWMSLVVLVVATFGILPYDIARIAVLLGMGGAVLIMTLLLQGALQRYFQNARDLENANLELRKNKEELETRVKDRTAALESALVHVQEQEARVEEVLRVVLPDQLVEELKSTRHILPRRYEDVAVMFCDIVNFTAYCDTHTPEEVMKHLQALVESFENLTVKYNLQKIKTSGDSFMTTGGLFMPVSNPVLNCAQCGLEMVQVAPTFPPQWQVRVGIHWGPIIGGVVGKRQYLFDILGDTVNFAARVEEAASPGTVFLSESAWGQIRPYALAEKKEQVALKGKGQVDVFQLQRVNAL